MVLHGGCGAGGIGAAITIVLWLFVVGWLGLVTLVGFIGVAAVWLKFDLGAGFLFAANVAILLTVGLLGPSDHGEVELTAWIFILAVPPPLVVAGLLWAWTARFRRLRERIITLVVIAACLAPSCGSTPAA